MSLELLAPDLRPVVQEDNLSFQSQVTRRLNAKSHLTSDQDVVLIRKTSSDEGAQSVAIFQYSSDAILYIVFCIVDHGAAGENWRPEHNSEEGSKSDQLQSTVDAFLPREAFLTLSGSVGEQELTQIYRFNFSLGSACMKTFLMRNERKYSLDGIDASDNQLLSIMRSVNFFDYLIIQLQP